MPKCKGCADLGIESGADCVADGEFYCDMCFAFHEVYKKVNAMIKALDDLREVAEELPGQVRRLINEA